MDAGGFGGFGRRCHPADGGRVIDEPINLVVYVDAPYMPHLCVMVRSVLKNLASGPTVRLFVLHDGKDEPARDELESIIAASGAAAPVEWVDVERHVPPGAFPAHTYISSATYCRLLVGSVLPESVQRILLLDCDTVVRSDIGELAQMPMGDAVALAAVDCGYPIVSMASSNLFQDQGVRPDHLYFNAGVIALDLAAWRSLGLEQRALDLCHRYAGQLRFADQCILNAVLAGRWRVLSPVWNLQTGFFRLYPKGGWPRPRRALRRIEEHARIVHFTEREKPWHQGCQHPLQHLYFEYTDRAPPTPAESVAPPFRERLRAHGEKWNGWFKLKIQRAAILRRLSLPWVGEYVDVLRRLLILALQEPWYVLSGVLSFWDRRTTARSRRLRRETVSG